MERAEEASCRICETGMSGGRSDGDAVAGWERRRRLSAKAVGRSGINMIDDHDKEEGDAELGEQRHDNNNNNNC